MDERTPEPEQTKESQVRAQMGVLDQDLSELTKALAELKNRLTSILRGDEEGEVEKENKELSLVPLATSIRGYSRRIESALSVVRDMLRTLEL